MTDRIAKGVLAFFTFAAVVILLSLNTGFFFLYSPFTLLAGFLIAVLVWRQGGFSLALPPAIPLLCLLLVALLAFPLALRGVPAATDPAQTIVLRVLDPVIPRTFEPYAALSFTYQFSYQLFVKPFADLLPLLADYLWLWVFGVLFGALQIVTVYLFTFTVAKSERAGVLAAVLLFGTKAVYRDVLVGGFHAVLAVNLLLLAVTCFARKNRLAYLFFPAALAVHPQIGALCGLALLLYAAFYNRLTQFVLLLPSLVLIIPAFLTTYAALFSGLSPSVASSPSLGTFLLVPLFIGVVPSLAVAAGLVLLARERRISREKAFALTLLVATVLLYLAMDLAGFLFVARLLEVATIAAVAFAGMTLVRLRPLVVAAILSISVLAILASGELNELRWDGKLTPAETAFAAAFQAFDPSLQATFFMTDGGPKIAEYANKIPYDAREDWFLPYYEKQVLHDAGLADLDQRHENSQQILADDCAPCVAGLPVRYLVVNTETYTPLPTEPVLQHGPLLLYDLAS
ncbi:MAG: hypothetical protein HY369_03105 [Candidatus Aenigmarchaeota archaeon]|nr:hypothetical protein [Candidatus Aenigmarchaeota archaeon]